MTKDNENNGTPIAGGFNISLEIPGALVIIIAVVILLIASMIYYKGPVAIEHQDALSDINLCGNLCNTDRFPYAAYTKNDTNLDCICYSHKCMVNGFFNESCEHVLIRKYTITK